MIQPAERLYRIGEGIITAVAGLILLILTLNTFFVHIHINMERGELFLLRNGAVYFAVLILVILGMVVLKKPLGHFSEKQIFLFFSGCYLAGGIFLILNQGGGINDDAAIIFSYVEKFNVGDYSALNDARYFSYNPTLLGLLTYERLLSRISYDPLLYYFAELFFLMLADFLIWRLSALLIPGDVNSLKRKYVIVLQHLFLAAFFHILLVYGMIVGLSLSVLTLYLLVREQKSSRIPVRILYAGGAVLSMICAYNIKQNYGIMLVAVVILECMDFLQSRRKGNLLLILVMVIIVIGSQKLLLNSYRSVSGIDMGTGEPIQTYFAMGLQDNEVNPLRAGWYNGYNFETYEDNDFDETVTRQLADQEIADRLSFFAAHPGEAVWFFERKLLTTWSEPTYECIARGPSEAKGRTNQTAVLQSLYEGDWLYQIYEVYQWAIDLLIYALAFWGIIRRLRRRKPFEVCQLLPYLYLIGGFLFHLVSETKSSYVFMYVYMLVPAAAAVLAEMMNEIENRPLKNKTM